MPRVADPAVRSQLVDAAARLLSDHGRDAVTVRRLAAEVGASTQVVYTHFNGVEDVVAEVWREGLRRFGRASHGTRSTRRPVADWMVQALARRDLALANANLYRAMFSEDLLARRPPTRVDPAVVFAPRLARVERCVASGRWTVDDLVTACEVSEASLHGTMTMELSGYYVDSGRDPSVTFVEALRLIALGYGDDPVLVERSLRAARRRARRAEGAGAHRGAPHLGWRG